VSLRAFAPVVEDSGPGLGHWAASVRRLRRRRRTGRFFFLLICHCCPLRWLFIYGRARITGAVITVPSVNGYAQSFPAVVDRAALPQLRAELEAGRRGCFAAFQAAAESLGQRVTVLAVELAVQSGRIAHPKSLPAARWFLNVNAEEDLRLATACRAPLVA